MRVSGWGAVASDARWQGATDAAGTNVEQPAEDERHRKPKHRRPDQRLDRGIRNPESRKQHVGDLQRQPCADDVQGRGAKYLAPAGLADESDDGQSFAVQCSGPGRIGGGDQNRYVKLR